MDDWRQLRQFVEYGSEEAFADLVNRYLGLVCSVALRKLGNPQEAEEVAQAVFCRLARKARRLEPGTVIVGWLHQAALLESLQRLRRERRRFRREQEAVFMNSPDPDPGAVWLQMADHLDEALAQVGGSDRTAILLRFFEAKSLREVGEALGVSEEAARMRVNRALERLRGVLSAKGAACSAAMLATLLSDRGVQAAPAGVAGSVQAAWQQAIASRSVIECLLDLIAGAKVQTVAVVLGVLIVGQVGLSFLERNQSPSEPLAPSSSLAVSDMTGPGDSRRQTATSALPRSSADLSTRVGAAIDSLWRALREEPVNENGEVTTDKVFAALRAFGPDLRAAIPTLKEALQDADPAVQECAVWGFQFLGADASEAIPWFVGLMRSGTATRETRTAAMQALAAMGSEATTQKRDPAAADAAVPNLIALLSGPDVEIRKADASNLGTLGLHAKEAVPDLAGLLTYSASREEAEAGLDPNAPRDVEAERERLTRSVKVLAARALQTMGTEAGAAVPALSVALEDPDGQVRATAALALWKIAARGDPAVVAAISDVIYPPRSSEPWWYERIRVS